MSTTERRAPAAGNALCITSDLIADTARALVPAGADRDGAGNFLTNNAVLA